MCEFFRRVYFSLLYKFNEFLMKSTESAKSLREFAKGISLALNKKE
jgi:hypothetical protein